MSFELSKLIPTAAVRIVEGIKNSQSEHTAADDISKQLWSWIKPQIDQDLVEELENSPNDYDLQIELQNKIRRLANKDKEFAAKLGEYIAKSGGIEDVVRVNKTTITGNSKVIIQDVKGNISGNIF